MGLPGWLGVLIRPRAHHGGSSLRYVLRLVAIAKRPFGPDTAVPHQCVTAGLVRPCRIRPAGVACVAGVTVFVGPQGRLRATGGATPAARRAERNPWDRGRSTYPPREGRRKRRLARHMAGNDTARRRTRPRTAGRWKTARRGDFGSGVSGFGLARRRVGRILNARAARAGLRCAPTSSPWHIYGTALAGLGGSRLCYDC